MRWLFPIVVLIITIQCQPNNLPIPPFCSLSLYTATFACNINSTGQLYVAAEAMERVRAQRVNFALAPFTATLVSYLPPLRFTNMISVQLYGTFSEAEQAPVTRLDGGRLKAPILTFENVPSVRIANLTVFGALSVRYGGGIFAKNISDLQVQSVVVQNNTAGGYGGTRGSCC